MYIVFDRNAGLKTCTRTVVSQDFLWVRLGTLSL